VKSVFLAGIQVSRKWSRRPEAVAHRWHMYDVRTIEPEPGVSSILEIGTKAIRDHATVAF